MTPAEHPGNASVLNPGWPDFRQFWLSPPFPPLSFVSGIVREPLDVNPPDWSNAMHTVLVKYVLPGPVPRDAKTHSQVFQLRRERAYRPFSLSLGKRSRCPGVFQRRVRDRLQGEVRRRSRALLSRYTHGDRQRSRKDHNELIRDCRPISSAGFHEPVRPPSPSNQVKNYVVSPAS